MFHLSQWHIMILHNCKIVELKSIRNNFDLEQPEIF